MEQKNKEIESQLKLSHDEPECIQLEWADGEDPPSLYELFNDKDNVVLQDIEARGEHEYGFVVAYLLGQRTAYVQRMDDELNTYVMNMLHARDFAEVIYAKYYELINLSGTYSGRQAMMRSGLKLVKRGKSE